MSEDAKRVTPHGVPVANTQQMKPLTKMIKFMLKPKHNQRVKLKKKAWKQEYPYY